MSNEAIHHAIVGQNEMIVRSRLGFPVRSIQTQDGGKKFIYEMKSKGIFTNPDKSKVTFTYSGDMGHPDQYLNVHYSNVDTRTNEAGYKIYQEDISLLEVFLDDEGNCVGFQHNLTRPHLEQFYKRFKQYIPKD